MKTKERTAARRGRAFARAELPAAAALAAALAAGAVQEAAAQVYAIALPDATNKDLLVNPDTVRAGGTVTIVSAVQNKGAGALTPAHSKATEPPALAIRFLLTGNVADARGIPAGHWGVDRLERREVKRRSVAWRVPLTTAPGDYFLCADVDPDGRVRESNEHNNRTCQPLTVKPAPEGTAGENAADDESSPSHAERPAGAGGSGDMPPES